MSERKITVKVDAMGNTTVEAHNFEGEDCAEATRGIETALGGNAASRDLKAEYYVEKDEESDSEKMSW